ncbi:MAG: iron-containing alcohol dehydrogenase, partial [Pseudomonadota bacterium]
MGLINYITRVQFGFGALSTLGDELSQASISRPFIVTDKGVLALGFVERIQELLKTGPVGVYDDTPGNPDEAAIHAATLQFR